MEVEVNNIKADDLDTSIDMGDDIEIIEVHVVTYCYSLFYIKSLILVPCEEEPTPHNK